MQEGLKVDAVWITERVAYILADVLEVFEDILVMLDMFEGI